MREQSVRAETHQLRIEIDQAMRHAAAASKRDRRH
jgi:hypothetical protein